MSKTKKGFTSWSYSRLSDYQACPRYAKLKYLDKVPEPVHPAADRGTAIHEECAEYVKKHCSIRGRKPKLPEGLKLFKDAMADVLKKGSDFAIEEEWAFDTAWNKVPWLDVKAYVRMKLDLAYGLASGKTLVVVDYKTGKDRREEQKGQLELYALAAFMVYPHIERVLCEFWYLDHGTMYAEVFYRKDIKALLISWKKKTAPMLKDTRFAPLPGPKCRWCHYGKSKGGKHCEF